MIDENTQSGGRMIV